MKWGGSGNFFIIFAIILSTLSTGPAFLVWGSSSSSAKGRSISCDLTHQILLITRRREHYTPFEDGDSI